MQYWHVLIDQKENMVFLRENNGCILSTEIHKYIVEVQINFIRNRYTNIIQIHVFTYYYSNDYERSKKKS